MADYLWNFCCRQGASVLTHWLIVDPKFRFEKFGPKQLEISTYCTAQKVFRYLEPLRPALRVWQTDGQTDRQTNRQTRSQQIPRFTTSCGKKNEKHATNKNALIGLHDYILLLGVHRASETLRYHQLQLEYCCLHVLEDRQAPRDNWKGGSASIRSKQLNSLSRHYIVHMHRGSTARK